ncbi:MULTISPECIES: amidohydrolase family protein [Paenibacillus]|uniref:Imidazolonepropionase-like amidohydrolase n=1 Tax=Paenibacillus pabuli TaxID=1472 RepID=A0A855XUL7_9BACL|nr:MULTISPECIES: amidohydrolase family protein [Paenibacillus]PWW36185.1 imidazolonepropionase-like amidohydrolase [Paenibacillus pabuli]PXW03264.1 imidazolonepropionase-like amidohydrolase [Paenibacillus taichungensis]
MSLTRELGSFKKYIVGFMALWIVLACGAGTSYASIEPATRLTLALEHATIVDVRSGKLTSDQTIIIKDNKISHIGNSSQTAIPDYAQVRDAKGQYVIPGLWDMHVHLEDNYKNAFPLFLANGVTGVREMGAALKNVDIWKTSIQAGMPAPRLVYAGSTLNGGPADKAPHMFYLSTEEQAREAVRLNVAKGADHIKVYSWLPRPLFMAVMDEAQKYGLPVVGHLPVEVRASEAVQLGFKSIEHLHGLFIATSSIEDELFKNADMSDLLGYSLAEIEASQAYDSVKASKLFRKFKEKGVWSVPTMVTYLNMAKTEIDPRSKYVPTAVQKQWAEVIRSTPPEQTELMEAINSLTPDMVKKLNDAGVPMLAGTDSSYEMTNFIYGISLHDELELLVKSGLTPLQALQSATLNPARYLEREQELGTVEKGKLADLVLLDKNPLEDIRNTTSISAVILDGKLMEKQTLDHAVQTYPVIKVADMKDETQ